MGACWTGHRSAVRFEQAEGDRPRRQERERSGASTRPAARLDSLDLVDLVDLVGLLGAPLPNEPGRVRLLPGTRSPRHAPARPPPGAEAPGGHS